jgi:hypothetical protein
VSGLVHCKALQLKEMSKHHEGKFYTDMVKAMATRKKSKRNHEPLNHSSERLNIVKQMRVLDMPVDGMPA